MIASTLPAEAWEHLSAGAGTKGPRLHDWCYLELADLKTDRPQPQGAAPAALWTRGLLIRRHITGGDLAFFSTWCPAGTGIATLVTVEGHRWSIEDSFETPRTNSAWTTMPARKLRAVFSYLVAIARNCLSLAKKFLIKWRDL